MTNSLAISGNSRNLSYKIFDILKMYDYLSTIVFDYLSPYVLNLTLSHTRIPDGRQEYCL